MGKGDSREAAAEKKNNTRQVDQVICGLGAREVRKELSKMSITSNGILRLTRGGVIFSVKKKQQL